MYLHSNLNILEPSLSDQTSNQLYFSREYNVINIVNACWFYYQVATYLYNIITLHTIYRGKF